MGLKQRAKSILLNNPDPKRIGFGALITLIQTAVTPWRRFSSKSHKRFSLIAYNHGRRFFGDSRRAVFTSLFSPIELVYAFDLLPFPVEPFGALAASFDIAPEVLQATEERWISSDFCSFHRALMGTAHLGLLPRPLFLLATSHACDGTLKSFSEMSRMYSRPLIFINTPYRKDEKAVRWLSKQIEAVVTEIEAICGKELKLCDLEKVFNYSNRMHAALGAIAQLRKGPIPLIYGEEGIQLILTWSLLAGSRGGVRIAESYRDELKKRQENHYSGISGKKRILWLHLKPYFKNAMMDILEKELGAVIVAEEINTPVLLELDIRKPWESMARKVMTNILTGSIEHRLKNIRRIVDEYSIDGVIHFSHWGCRQSNGAVRMIRDTVMKLGIPFLDLDGDCVDPRNYSEAQYRTRLEGFMEILG